MNLRLEGLSVRYKKNPVIKNIDLHVKGGQFFTILGKSGSGKSTILKAVAGLLDHHDGRVIVGEEDVTDLPAEVRKIGYVFQKPYLFPHMTVAENIAFGPEVHGWHRKDIEDRVAKLMALVRIQGLEKRLPNQISGGQQQRAAIARALALNNGLLLMDEPFSALDPYLREEMGTLVKDIQRELGLTVIFVTHDVDEAMALSDHICYLSDGMLNQCGTPDELYNHPSTIDIAEFMGDVNWLKGSVRAGVFSSDIGEFPAADLRDGAYRLLLRPQDIAPTERGTLFTVENCSRQGKETLLVVSRNQVQLNVRTLENLRYGPGSSIGITVINPYWHYFPETSSNV